MYEEDRCIPHCFEENGACDEGKQFLSWMIRRKWSVFVLGRSYGSGLQLFLGRKHQFVSVFGHDSGRFADFVVLYVGKWRGIEGRLRVKQLSKKVEKQQVQRQVVIDEGRRFISWRVVK